MDLSRAWARLARFFRGIDSERCLEWRCTDSLSLREFLRLSEREGVPDHSWLSLTRSRLPLEVHDQVFTWVVERLAAPGLIKGERIGVDASTMEANAARERGIETPTAEDLVRLDRNRKDKKLPNADWQSPTDPDARIAKLKDGRTHLAYKPKHAVGLDTGAVVTAEVHAADQGDTATMRDTLANAIEHLTAVDAAPTPEALPAVRPVSLHHRRGPGRGRQRYACRSEPRVAVSWTAGNKLARHARECSSAGSTFARLLGCER